MYDRSSVRIGRITLHRRAAVAGETTWAELERRGLVLQVRAKGAGRGAMWRFKVREQKQTISRRLKGTGCWM